MDFLSYFLVFTKLISLLLSVLISVAFLTLYERKVLGYIQIRKGPNKVGAKGVLQPFSDAIKLLSKESGFLQTSNFWLYTFSPMLSLSVMLILWFSFPSGMGFLEISMSVVFILCCLSAGVYSVLGAGWSSNSKYSLLGSLRAVAQTISYEVSLAFILLSFIVMSQDLSLYTQLAMKEQWFMWLSPPLALVWFISSLAETNRTPFDFAEGESELVSGFNTEYSSGGFVLFFLAEYGSILFMSFFFSFLFMGGEGVSGSLALKTAAVAYLFIWVRGTLPCLRYDKLMDLAWKVFLPISLAYFILAISALPVWY